MTVTPICPSCRARQRLLLAVGCDFVLLGPEPELPEHMSNCLARIQWLGTAATAGMLVETFTPGETWRVTWDPPAT